MKEIIKKALILFFIGMLCFSTVYGGTIKTYSSVQIKWILSGTKKFEYDSQFTEIRYKKAIYKLPDQITKLPKVIQQDIRKEFIKVKTNELKAKVDDIASGIAYDQVIDITNKIIDDEARLQAKNALEKYISDSTDEDLKEFVKGNNSIEESVVAFIKESVVRTITTSRDNMIIDITKESSNKAIKEIVENASKSDFKIEDNDINRIVDKVIIECANKNIMNKIGRKIKDNVKKVALDKIIQAITNAERAANAKAMKPVIYLYPTEKQKVTINFDEDINITCSYPSYNISGWNITAYPDGKIVDEMNNREYYCLYWEGLINNSFDMTTGFVVKGEDTSKFLEEYLGKLGLTQREANEFIIYWLPKMKDNKYNLIHFAADEYAKEVPMKITPKPDSSIRLLMVFKSLEKPVDVKNQEIVTPKREGFTLVEWGGMEVK